MKRVGRLQGQTHDTAKLAARFVEELEEAGMPLEDNLAYASLNEPEDKMGQYKRVFADLPPGITHMYIHPAPDCAELRAICPDWRSRVGDYETFRSEEMRKFIKDLGIQLIGYRIDSDADAPIVNRITETRGEKS